MRPGNANPQTLFALGPELDWQVDGLCAQTDPEAFYPDKGGSSGEAKAICMGCPVRTECLEYALTHDERYGVWGGMSERERGRLRLRSSPGQGARTDLSHGMCRAGLHVMAGENVAASRDGFRRCLPCRRAGDADRNARRRAQRKAGGSPFESGVTALT